MALNGSFSPCLVQLALFDPVWSRLDMEVNVPQRKCAQFGSVRPCVTLCGPVWALFGSIWPRLTAFSCVWPCLAAFGHIWLRLVWFVPVLPGLSLFALFGTVWYNFALFKHVWPVIGLVLPHVSEGHYHTEFVSDRVDQYSFLTNVDKY